MAACRKKQRVNECRDRISNLLDCIIHRILSFLPTKDAVRTSVLSKRWIYMWTFIYNLHFDDSQLLFPDKRNKQHLSFVGREDFVRFVQGVLLHLSNPTIQSFTLVTSDWYDDIYKCVDAWIAAALYRQVQNLYINYKGSITIYSLSLFRCQPLVDLKLMLPSGSLTFTSSYVRLPNLKFLSLSGIKLESKSSPLWISFPSNHHHHHPIELTLSFPVLRVFKMDRCRWHLMNACLQVPLLEVFSAEKSRNLFRLPRFALPVLRYSLFYSVTVYWTTIITVVVMKTFFHHQLLLLPFKSLEVLNLILQYASFSNGSIKCNVSNLVTWRFASYLNAAFRFCCFSFLLPIQMKGFPVETVLYFQNMCELTNVQIGKASIDFLFGLLHKLPILESLILDSVSSEMMLGRSSPDVPRCVESSLKMVKFGLFDGAEHEFYLAKFVFEQGAILEQVFFCLSKTRQNGPSEIKIEEIKKKLLSFNMCSSFCVIEFSTV